METKYVPFSIKSLDEAGIFEGYASTFGGPDLVGDIILQGAFRKSIADNKGDVPVTWAHSDLIGKNLEAHEDARGLWVRGQINLDVQKGREAYALAKQGAVKGLSIEFNTIPAKTERNREGNRVLREVKWMGYGLTAYPANPEASILHVKDRSEHDEAVECLRGVHNDLKKFYSKLCE